MSGICAHQLFSDGRQLCIRQRLRDFGKLATSPEACKVVLQAEQPMVEGATEIRNGRAEDETGIVERQHTLDLRDKVTVEICDWPGHRIGFSSRGSREGSVAPSVSFP